MLAQDYYGNIGNEAVRSLHLEQRVCMLQEPAHHSVARLVVRHRGLFSRLQDLGPLLQAWRGWGASAT